MSKVQICNRGLSMYLGIGRINSLDENTPASEQCLIHYDDTLQSLTEMHWWAFASGRQTLAEVTNDRASEWAYKYARPSAALTIRWVNDPCVARHMLERNENPDTSRETTGAFIYSNVPLAVCEFTQLVEDTTQFPQYFSDALSAMIAASVAMALTEDVRRARNAQEQAEMKIDNAMALDDQQSPPIGYQTMPSYLSMRGVE